MAKRVFYASKVNVHAHIFSQNLDDIISIHIPRVIKEAPSIKIGSYNWSITDVKTISYNNDVFIIGNLTKSKQVKLKMRVGASTEDVTTDFEVARTSMFVYHSLSEILVHEVSSYIDEVDFINVFERLVGRDPYVGEVKVITIPEPHKIRTEMLSMQKISSVHFHLIHPNPGKKEFNIYNSLIDQHDLKELDLRMANRDGMNIKEDAEKENFTETIESGIELVETGYGAVDIKGFDEHKIKGRRKDKIVRKQRSFFSKRSVRRIIVNEFGEETLMSRIRSFINDVRAKIVKDDKDEPNISI
ncbi:hypothetical protein YDYSG_03420 [Paenibacillus tyrfis]|uniref:hypothetical protein n=1 Tax=Paenibacillus tyrfis TaxID=1501230 RepID=UPI00249239DD|nr:hypothetical protein [Paenibacillus tyrfis]GLI04312.1 hypothetical protein YDYSG_03420 [Paenibacillus tyrfis]